ncbi:MAG: dipeptide epimerase [Hyphomicrobiales bacterium]|nr:MAG: dipeptide epimerase [Hyphomicrobiales bacterium]
MTRSLNVEHQSWPITGTFTISRGTKTSAEVIVVTIREGRHEGHGECVPYARYGETIDSVVTAIEGARDAIEGGCSRKALQDLLPAGAARNALDCALLDLEAKASGTPAWQILDLPAPTELMTAFTISLGTPEKMAADTAKAADRPLLKVKLGGEGDAARIAAIRGAAPNARLIVDANEAWSETTFADNMAACAAARVELIEQPLPADNDGLLARVDRPVTVCADESVHVASDLAALASRYDAVNIKLDKSGGITEARRMVAEADRLGFKVMIGCMLATSLAMAPACLIAGKADFVDLDGPLLLTRDRDPGLVFAGSIIAPPSRTLWG